MSLLENIKALQAEMQTLPMSCDAIVTTSKGMEQLKKELKPKQMVGNPTNTFTGIPIYIVNSKEEYDEEVERIRKGYRGPGLVYKPNITTFGVPFEWTKQNED